MRIAGFTPIQERSGAPYGEHLILPVTGGLFLAALIYCLGSELLVDGSMDAAVALRWSAAAVFPWAALWALRPALPRHPVGRTGAILVLCAVALLVSAAGRAGHWPVQEGELHPRVLTSAYGLLPLTLAAAALLWLSQVGNGRDGLRPPADSGQNAPAVTSPTLPPSTEDLQVTPTSIPPSPIMPDLAWPDGSPVMATEIERAIAAGNYVELRREGGAVLWRGTLREMEVVLAPFGFLRVHRSALVQTAAIREVRTAEYGALTVRLDSGAEVPVGRTYRDAVRRLRP